MPETKFFWDPLSDNILQERDETGTLTAQYTAEPVGYGNVIGQSRDGVASQFHSQNYRKNCEQKMDLDFLIHKWRETH